MATVSNNLVLELHIPNFGQAREFYKLFWFYEIHYDPTSGGWSTLGYMVLRRDDALWETHINFYGDHEKVAEHAHFKDFPTDTPRGYGVEVTVVVSDVEKLRDEVKDSVDPKHISQPLTLKRRGKKDFRVIDPFWFYIRFTEFVDWKR